MTRFVLDSTTGAKLQGARQPLELCDQTGRVLGHFIPLVEQAISPMLEPQIGEDEIRRRELQGGGRSLAEIMADLKNSR